MSRFVVYNSLRDPRCEINLDAAWSENNSLRDLHFACVLYKPMKVQSDVDNQASYTLSIEAFHSICMSVTIIGFDDTSCIYRLLRNIVNHPRDPPRVQLVELEL